jgi:hypothetical protein
LKTQLQTVAPACLASFPCKQKILSGKEQRLVCINKSPCNQQSFDPERTKPLDYSSYLAVHECVLEEKRQRSVEYARLHPKKFTGLISIAKKGHGAKKPAKRKKQSEADELDKYITNGERGELPISHVGADVTRPLNAMRLAEYRKCSDCKNGSKENPIKVSIQIKTAKGERRYITLCQRHWIDLAETVIGWSGE